jgi:hypothetical protein
MNSGRTPEWIGLCHLKNKVADIRADRRAPGSLLPGLKSPKQLETLSMPTNDSFGFDDDQCLLPIGPKTGKQDPEETVSGKKSGFFGNPLHSGQLRSARFSRARSESFGVPIRMFKSSLSSIFIMDANFAGLVEKVNNFKLN